MLTNCMELILDLPHELGDTLLLLLGHFMARVELLTPASLRDSLHILHVCLLEYPVLFLGSQLSLRVQSFLCCLALLQGFLLLHRSFLCSGILLLFFGFMASLALLSQFDCAIEL